ncbi:MAG: hypothetical protein IJG60_02340 [Thermoguttaceae bacterium]|nr:hypothetical protein [Thermoguttaceae bacterium]
MKPKQKQKKKLLEILSDVNELARLEEEADFKEYVSEADGIRFAYPKNWFTQEAPWSSDSKAVTVNDPNGYFWMIAVFPAGSDPDAAAKEVLHSLRREYSQLEDLPTHRIIADQFLTGYEMNFFYLDLVNTAVVLSLETEERTYVIFWQYCDILAVTDDENDFEDVVEAMTHTFLKNLPRPSAG